MDAENPLGKIASRFRGYLPVVIDVETAGFDPKKNALLECAAVIIGMDSEGNLTPQESIHAHIVPFEGAILDPSALEFNKIDPYHPFRFSVSEHEALTKIFKPIRHAIKASGCNRAVLIGHNAWFDLTFLLAAVNRAKIKRNPFHPFTTFDTATLGGLAYGQTVLARALEAAGIEYDREQAHSAIYDAKVTAELFCHIANQWKLPG